MTTTPRLRVCVVGAGTAGSAAAAFLARDGHDVTVLERVPEPRPVGAGISLQPTGVAVLRALGIERRVVARCGPFRGLVVHTARGRTLLDLDYSALSPDDDDRPATGLGCHRGVLFEALLQAALDAGSTLRTGVEATTLSGAADARFVVDAHGTRHGPFALVVVADGARSQLRDDTDRTLRKRVVDYPWGALWFVAHDDNTRPHADELYQVVDGSRRMVGLLPTGLGPSGDVPLVSLFWSIEKHAVDAWRARGLSAWKDEVRALAPLTAPVLDQIHSVDDVLFAAYRDVTMPRLHDDGVIYLGDAAHAMSPQLGQGANLALMDAWTLADTMRDVLPRGGGVQEALVTTTRRRAAHLRFYTYATRWLTPFFQGSVDALGVLRDLAFPIMNAVPWVRTQMVASMAGLKTGPLSMRATSQPLGAARALPSPHTPERA